MFNNYSTQQGFNVLFSQFNGLQELLVRKDAETELLRKYRSIPLPKKEATDTEIGDYLFCCYSFEILFAQDAIRVELTESQLAELKKELLAKYEIKKGLNEDGGYSKIMMILNGVLPVENSPKSAKMPSLTTSAVIRGKEVDQPPAEAVQAAKDGWVGHLSGIDGTDESYILLKSWGVTRESLSSASFGEPFRKYTITREALANYHKGDPTGSLLSETNKWYFPVLVNNEPKLMLAVSKSKIDSGWEAGELGSGALEFLKIRKEWRQSKGYNPIFIEISWGIYLFYIPAKGTDNLTLIPSAPYMVPVTSYPNLDKVEKTLEWLKPNAY